MDPGEKLTAWRLARGWSQREAAEHAGLTKAAWQSYEAGASPKAPAIAAIRDVTDGEIDLEDWRESEERKQVRRARAAAKRVRTGRQPKPADSAPLLANGRAHEKAG